MQKLVISKTLSCIVHVNEIQYHLIYYMLNVATGKEPETPAG